MAPEASEPGQGKEKPKTIDQYSTAELVELAQKAALHAENAPDRAARVVGNISTELSRRSANLAELREVKQAIEAKHAKGKTLTGEEIATWKNATLALNDDADFDEHVAVLNAVRLTLTPDL